MIAAAAVAYGIWYSGSEKEDICVRVTVEGNVYNTYSIDDDDEYTIETENGYNIVSVSNGKVSVTDASCPDKICVHEKAIYADGQSIICLPNKVVVEIVENKSDKSIDGVVK